MKKLALVLVLAAFIATGTVFADHPKGLGIGAQFSGNFATDEFGLGAALSLKLPGIPVFWTVDVGFSDWYLGVGVSGDFYFIDAQFLPSIKMHWYFGAGIGGFVWFLKDVDDDPLMGAVTGRVPIGISWQPFKLLEIYLQTVPQAGVLIYKEIEVFWDVPINLGVRLWL